MSSSPSLLSTLESISKAWDTRYSLLNELEAALDSFLTSTPISLSNPVDLLSTEAAAPHSDPKANGRTGTSCTTEAQSPLHVRPPNEQELQQLLSISFAGLLEVKNEVGESRRVLDETLDAPRLARIVGTVEEWESQRIKLTLERDQLRRLSSLQPDLEFSRSINEKDTARKELSDKIEEEKREIQAEIIDLKAEAAAEEDEA